MSHAYYTELWLVTRNDLEKLLQLEKRLQERAHVKKGVDALNSALSMYIRYRNIVKRLIVCYDQMVQTQKRELIKRMLDCAIGRMLEFKKEVVTMDYTDYQWPDDVLNEMKWSPDDIELFATISSREALEERRKFIQEAFENIDKAPRIRERSLSQIHLQDLTDLKEETVKTRAARKKVHIVPTKVLQESVEERAAAEAKLAAQRAMYNAILLIQSHERARRALCYNTHMKRLYDYNKKLATGEIVAKKIDRAKYIKSAVTIQRAWRRFAARKATKKRIENLEEILGMTIPSWQSNEVFEKDNDNFQRRQAMIPTFAAQTKKTINDERTRLFKIRGPGLIEDITDEIHEWFAIWYDKLGHYDLYPAADLGGSILITTGQTLTPQEYLMQKIQAMKKGAQKDKEGKLTERKALKRKSKRDKRKPQTQALTCLEEANADFIQNWNFRDERENPEQKEYLDLITDKLCYELQMEMRETTDELMRTELELLNKALLKDHEYDKPKFQIPLIEKGKKKPRKDRKKKQKKNILDDVAIEDLFYELLQAKIIRPYPTVFLRDWVGDLSYQNYEAHREFRDYKHRLGEVKQLVLEYCILPLVSKETHQIAPLIRSVCICGLPKTGKTLLANAICSEVGALLFDVSVPILADKYVGKKNEQRLIDMILKVSRFYAPSIIFLSAGEKPWYRKVPPEEQHLRPKRFSKYFGKLVKNIKQGDQILFLSLSAEPQKATVAFIKLHDKFIIVPVPDYNTLYMYYKNLLMKYHGVDRDIDVSCMAKMSIGIPLEFIRQAVEKVLTIPRRITLKSNPLTPAEIMNEVILYQYPTNKMLAVFDTFEKRTPLGKKRALLIQKEIQTKMKAANILAKRIKRTK